MVNANKAEAERRVATRSGSLALYRLLFAGSFFVSLVLPCLADAEPALVQSTGSNGFAMATANAGAQSLANAAEIQVLVTNPADGTPIDNLGGSVGDWQSITLLPDGWTLQPLSGPFLCGSFAPIRFHNRGNGIYTIYVVPQPWLFCSGWLKGDYVYRVQINNAGGTTFRGSAIGLFEITGFPK